MSYPKSTKYNHQNRTDQREVHSRPTGGSFTTKGSESVKVLKDSSEPETPKDPSKDQIESKGSPGTHQRSMGEQLPTSVVHHTAMERSPDSI